MMPDARVGWPRSDLQVIAHDDGALPLGECVEDQHLLYLVSVVPSRMKNQVLLRLPGDALS